MSQRLKKQSIVINQFKVGQIIRLGYWYNQVMQIVVGIDHKNKSIQLYEIQSPNPWSAQLYKQYSMSMYEIINHYQYSRLKFLV